MVETCLLADDDSQTESSCAVKLNTQKNNDSQNLSNSSQLVNQNSCSNLNHSVNSYSNRSNMNLMTGSMSSISMNSIHSPTDLMTDFNEANRTNNRPRRSSSPKNLYQK